MPNLKELWGNPGLLYFWYESRVCGKRGKGQVLKDITAILARWQDTLLKMDNVVGVGYGYKTRGGKPTSIPAIIVYVSQKVPLKQLKPHQRIPSSVEGVPTDVVEAGEMRLIK